jgi:hypothetical protein
MIDVIDAINQRVSDTPALRQGLAGGFHLQHPGRGAPRPFVLLVPLSAPPQYNTSKTYTQPVGMQISFFAELLTDVAPLIKAYRDAFNRRPLTLDAGKLIAAILVDEQCLDDDDEENEANNGIHYVLEFEFEQSQQHA